MRHTRSVGIALTATLWLGSAGVLGGCFDTHGLGGSDAGPGGDAGDLVRDCASAQNAPEGAPCSFDEICTDVPVPCGAYETLRCIEGQLRRARGICARPILNCEEYLAAGAPEGTFCIESDFVGCDLASDGCCTRHIGCEESRIVDVLSCLDCDPRACPGYAPPPPQYPGCQSSRDCEGGIQCVAAGTHPGCGICRPAERECERDAQCGAGRVCESGDATCSCDGPDTACVADCRTFESDPCGAGERCGSDGHCAPIACTDGFECAANSRCVGPTTSADEHGCARLACADASDCDCGVCMDGVCQDGPGYCFLPPP